MAKKREVLVHPLRAIEGLGQFNTDVGFLLATAHVMLDPAISGTNAACREKLEAAINRVRRHYECEGD